MSDFFTPHLLLMLLASAVGSVGFAMIYRVAGKYLAIAAVGGTLTYFVYYTVSFFDAEVFVPSVLSLSFAALFSEIFAKIKRAPISIFILPCSIPIVPGSAMYYTMANFIERDFSSAAYYLNQALGTAIGMAVGSVIVPIIWHLCWGTFGYLSSKRRARRGL